MEEIEKQINVQNQSNSQTHQTKIIIKKSKSRLLAFILTFLFGPLGMFYSTISGGIIMTILTIVLGLISFGISLIITWIICIIWGVLAVRSQSNTTIININNQK